MPSVKQLSSSVVGLLALASLVLVLHAQVPAGSERLLNAAKEPQNWMTYGGDYFSNRYSGLTQITPANVKSLNLAWAYQSPTTGSWQATPLVVDGIMYLTQRPNDVVALDAVTGRVFWMYRYTNANEIGVCCGANNRGLAILGDTLFMGTLDAHLIAIDTKSGMPVWKTRVAESKLGYSITVAPLAVKDKVIVGLGGGEFGIRGAIAAFDAKTGKELWRFYTVPAPGEPGHETWEQCPPNPATYCDPDAWMHGGASVWVTGSYDPALNLTYWGLGNAGPDYNGDQRPGDNLYTCSVVALDLDTGRLKWHYQFTPHDVYDYDSVQVPVLADITFQGAPLKAMLWANRNGNFYVLNRETGKFMLGKPFVKVNWMSGFDANGKPIQTVQPNGMPTYPAVQGGSNWYSPSYSPRTKLMYVSTWQDQAMLYGGIPVKYEPGRGFGGGNRRPFVPTPGAPSRGIPDAPNVPDLRRGPINNWTDAAGHGAVLAMDPNTGEPKWRFEMFDVTDTGIVTTATDLLITGGREGYLQVLDARTGTLLWRASLGAQMINNPITYAVNGRQYVAAMAGLTLFAFALPN
ncbi:MAG: PQQ-dependent dehydrogenase, methanol/ethanol family [Vicinamibacterales bacterium]|nr:PQQ-dependent dehydrogenase, methanol/ethanol family [Vicinamibacterales bacterium]